MNRIITRILLSISFIISIIIIYFASANISLEKKEAWTIIAAALAVITSIFSSWSSQRVLELEEDSKKPYVYICFNLINRPSLVLLRITNSGLTAAYKIQFKFEKTIPRERNDDNFNWFGSTIESNIDVLFPNESIAQIVGSSTWFLNEIESTKFTGKIQYENASGKRIKKNFTISAEHYRNTILYDKEEQQIPKYIKDISDSIGKISNKLS